MFCLGQSIVYQSEENRKLVPVTYPGGWNISAHCFLELKSPKNHNLVKQALAWTCFITRRRDRARSALVVRLGPHDQRLCSGNTAGQLSRSQPTPHGDDITVGLAGCRVMHTLRAETKEPLLSLKQGDKFLHKVISLATGSVGPLAISKEMLQAHPRPMLLTWPSWSWEAACTGLHSPTFCTQIKKWVGLQGWHN